MKISQREYDATVLPYKLNLLEQNHKIGFNDDCVFMQFYDALLKLPNNNEF